MGVSPHLQTNTFIMFRRFATQAARQAADFEVTTLSNGFVVATRNSPSSTGITRLNVAFGAGTRHEGLGEQGVSHLLRAAAYQSNSTRSALKTARDAERDGTNLTCTGTREAVTFSAECLPHNAKETVDVLASALTDPEYRPWEVSQQQARVFLERDSAYHNANVVLVEEAHNIAFVKGLGNSLFTPEVRIGKVTPSEVQAFHTRRFAESPRGLVASGINHQEAVGLAEVAFGFLDNKSSKAASSTSAYRGNQERHIVREGEATSAILAYKGAARSDKSQAALRVLEAVVGGGRSLKYGSDNCPLATAVAAAAGTSAGVSVEAVNVGYSDAGLFGIIVHAHEGAHAAAAVKAAADFASTVASTVTDKHVANAKQQVTLSLLTAADVSGDLVDACEDIVTGAPVESTSSKVAAVQQVTLADVQAAAKSVFNNSNRNLVTVGNLSSIVTLSDL